MKINVNNEKLKLKFFRRMKEAEGYAEATICKLEKSILQYEEITSHDDFSRFCQRKAIQFKKKLLAKQYRGKEISIRTAYSHLRNLKKFFTWLSGQPGYKSKISLDAVSYLSLDKKSTRAARAPLFTKYPTLDHVCRLVESIEIKNPIDQRDRALISLLLLSGMRITAIRSLPLGCFNPITCEIEQNPLKGVKTKFGKSIYSVLLPLDNRLLEYIITWAMYLDKDRGFPSTAPLFPRSKREQEPNSLSFSCTDVEPKYWENSGSIRKILMNRSEDAGLDYFKPHSFRHCAIRYALKYCNSDIQRKALSQNFGHENVYTTTGDYGHLDWYSQKSIISEMDFKDEEVA